MIYLDYNAITSGFNEILEETFSTIKGKFLNPSSIHTLGKEAKKILKEAEFSIKNSLQAKCHDVYFVSGATEGNNMVLNAQDFTKIFTIKTEHSSILSCLFNKNHEFIAVSKEGLIEIEDLEEKIKALNSGNFLCSFALANNESGVIQTHFNQIAELVHNNGGILHTDASQVMGKFHFNFAEFNADIITFSGNKMHAGLGGGVVIFNSGFNIKPLIFGGGQQNFKRGGTENIPQIFAISKALNLVNSVEYLTKYQEKTLNFRKKIEETVKKNKGDIFAENIARISNTSLIKMPNINNFIQLMEFDLNDICISIGSACSSGKTDVSHVLTSCGISEIEAKYYIRVSSGIFNTENEIEKFCKIWQELAIR